MRRVIRRSSHPGDVDGLVGPAGPQDGKYHLAALPLEQQQRHIAVLAVVGIEQGELLRAERIGVGVIRVNHDQFRSAVVGSDEVVNECHADGIQFLLGEFVLQTAHRRLRGEVNLVGGLAAGAEFQHPVRAETVAVIGIFVSRDDLVHPLAHHLAVRMNNEVLIAQVDDAGNDSVNDAAGPFVFPYGRQAAESGQFWSAEVQLDAFVIDRGKGKKCGGLLLFCGRCDNFAHGKGAVLFFLIFALQI